MNILNKKCCTLCLKAIKLNSNKYLSTTTKQCAIQSTMNIFDRSAKQIQKERSALRLGCFFFVEKLLKFSFMNLWFIGFSPDVELYDYIKDEVGFRLSDRIFDVKRQFKLAADIGKYTLLHQ